MADPESLKTHDVNDLDAVEVRPRTSRGAVISVRLSAPEAEAVAKIAEKAGVSVSEFARQALRHATTTPWRVRVWKGDVPLVVGLPPETGGAYGRRFDEERALPSSPV